MRHPIACVAALLAVASAAGAQTPAEHIAQGDSAYVARNASASLAQYQEAIKLDSTNAEALWKASREAVDLGEAAGFNKDDQARDSLFKLGEQYGQRAVQANPNSAMAHFSYARALGRAALAVGARERVNYAGRVREQGLAALKLDSLNDGAWDVMGMWNAEIMRLNGFVRFIAKNLLGGKVFGEANWDNAQRDLEHAVALEPNRIVHHLNLGQVYVDVDKPDKAREQFNLVASLPLSEYNDASYKHQAEQALARLK